VWVRRGEDLGDTAATVVANQIDLINRQGVEKFCDHARVCGHGDVLMWRDFRVAMRE
jgi:hypothetical protein